MTHSADNTDPDPPVETDEDAQTGEDSQDPDVHSAPLWIERTASPPPQPVLVHHQKDLSQHGYRYRIQSAEIATCIFPKTNYKVK